MKLFVKRHWERRHPAGDIHAGRMPALPVTRARLPAPMRLRSRRWTLPLNRPSPPAPLPSDGRGWPSGRVRVSLLAGAAMIWLLLGVLPPARADAILNECSHAALESALGIGGTITVNCDGTLVLSNT